MGTPKGPTEGGSGGKRGHSSMEHWGYSDEVMQAARTKSRLESKRIVSEEQAELSEAKNISTDSTWVRVRVISLLRPGVLKIELVSPDPADGCIMLIDVWLSELPVHLVPAPLRFPNSEFLVNVDANRDVHGVKRVPMNR